MKLPSPSESVKPDRKVVAAAALTAVVTLLAVQLVLVMTGSAQGRMERFGNAAASALAELAVEPLMRQDRMHLGVIGNRLAETPEIAGVASYTSDNQLLASTGDLSGATFTAPVTIDDSIVGYVRLAIHPPAFTRDAPGRLPGLLLAALIAPLLVIAGWALWGAIASGRLTLAAPRRPGWLPAAHASAPPGRVEAVPDEPEPEPAPAVLHYLLAVNLYNQLSLGVNEREFERSLSLELMEAVAGIYQGQVVRLPGTGMLLDFDHIEDDERSFQVLCAAFVLARLLRDESPFGQYRLGMNTTARRADEPLTLDDPAIADAALLSALARDGTLAVSAPFNQTLPDPDRFTSGPLVNPLVDELTTSGPGCRLITALRSPYDTLALQQAEQLALGRHDSADDDPPDDHVHMAGQRGEMSSPSTF